MIEPANDTVTHAIQLALAPVFLLAGIGAILNVLSTRLSRVVDRSRLLRERALRGEFLECREEQEAEEGVLRLRMFVVNTAVFLCTLSALLICTVVAIIFLGSVASKTVAAPIAWSFVGAMGCLVMALLALLLEIYLATVKMLAIRR